MRWNAPCTSATASNTAASSVPSHASALAINASINAAAPVLAAALFYHVDVDMALVLGGGARPSPKG